MNYKSDPNSLTRKNFNFHSLSQMNGFTFHIFVHSVYVYVTSHDSSLWVATPHPNRKARTIFNFGIKMKVFTFLTFIHSDYVYLHQTIRMLNFHSVSKVEVFTVHISIHTVYAYVTSNDSYWWVVRRQTQWKRSEQSN